MKNPIKKRTRKYSKSVKKNSIIKKTIQNVLNKKLEVKHQSLASAYNNIYNVINDARVALIRPIISQGTGQGDRIGNSINIKKVTLYVNVTLDASSTVSGYPKYVDVYIFKFKKNNVAVPTASDMTKFLQYGNLSEPYLGRAFDGMRDVNKDLFTIKKKLRLNMIHGGTVNNYYGYGMMQSNMTLKIDVTKYLKSRLLFDDTTNTVTNDNLYMAIGYTLFNQLGTPVDTYAGTYDWQINYDYTDA